MPVNWKKHYDFILAMGDDTTDDDMFKALPKNSVTIKIGYVSEAANYNMSTQAEVLPFLETLVNKKERHLIDSLLKYKLTCVLVFVRDLLKNN